MPKEEKADLLKFLAPFAAEVQEKALWLRDFVWDQYPQANELIYDNYNAVAFGWSPTEKVGHIFCSIAVGRTSNNVHFGFYWGAELADPEKLLIGNGNQYRYILVHNTADSLKHISPNLYRKPGSTPLKRLKIPNKLCRVKPLPNLFRL
ncbi:MAG TPA: hypothetical protein VK609_03130 [Mucilaginibacter sp.]|nr:hypothetical protein [Mucilaginibacter sp.]